MAHDITMFRVTRVTLSKPKLLQPDDKTRKPFKTQKVTIESDDGNMQLTLFLK